MLVRHRKSILSLAAAALLLVSGMAAVGLAGKGGSALPAASAAAVPEHYGKIDLTISNLQDRLKARPSDQRAYVQLGAAYLQKARESGDPTYYTKTDAVLRRGLDLKSTDFDAMALLGSLALARHQFQEGVDWGEKARALDPYSTVALAVIGDGQVELGRYDQAFATFLKMDEIRPDLSSWARISYMRELKGDLPGALEAMRASLVAGGPHPENTAWTRVQVGNLLIATGNFAEAEREYQRTLFDLPGFPAAQVGLARVTAIRGDYEAAIKLLQQAIAVMPLPDSVILLGDIEQLAGHADEAEHEYALVGAIQQLFRANGVDTDIELALFNLDHDQQVPESIELASKLLEKRPSVKVYDTLAWALYKDGQYNQAADASRQALRLGSRDPLLLFHAGMIAYQLGDQDAARTYLQGATQATPFFSFLHAEIAQRTLTALGGARK